MCVLTSDAGADQHFGQSLTYGPLFCPLDEKTSDSTATHLGRDHQPADFGARFGRQVTAHREIDPSHYFS